MCDRRNLPSANDELMRADISLLKRIVFNIFLINEFEHAVLRLKNDDCVWGPVHSSVGQEAVAAAAIAGLRNSDMIAGTHRAHHQFLAKVINYVLPDDWDPCSASVPCEALDVVRRTLAEIMGLAPGYCGGRGGSMHFRHAEAGVIGTNAIVGGGIPLATGAAFAEKYTGSGNVVACFFGDGAINQGAFHEACNLAGIWKLPILYIVENNRYAVATCASDACAVEDLSVRGASYGMSGIKVDGSDPLAVYQIVRDSAERVRSGGGPALIEVKCFRSYHHAGDRPGSSYGYRSKEEESEWAAKDPFTSFPEAIIQAGRLAESDIQAMRERAVAAVAQAVDDCTVPGTPRTVRSELWPESQSVYEGVRSSGLEWENAVFHEVEDFGSFTEMRFSDAIAAVTGRWLEKDSRVIVLGEEVANFGGGAYGATRDLPSRYTDRVLNTPISEAGFAGLACGAAMSGLRPVIEIMFPDFALVAADQLFNQIAKLRHIYGGHTDMPLVARTRVASGCGYGGQHSMDPVGLYALFPGWRIVYPSCAFDYIGLFNSAMRSLDPVLVVEHHSLYTRKFAVPDGDLDYLVEFGKSKVIAVGSDITLITYGSMVHRCLAIRDKLAQNGISAEIIDLRTVDLQGIDYNAIGASIIKTGAAVIVEEAPRSQSIGGTIASEITERFFDHLDGPVARVASADIPNPVSRVLESAAIVGDDDIMSACEWRR